MALCLFMCRIFYTCLDNYIFQQEMGICVNSTHAGYVCYRKRFMESLWKQIFEEKWTGYGY